MQQHSRAVLDLAITAALFSTGGAAIKATSLGAWEVAAGRSAFAVLFLLAVLPAARRRWSLRTVLVGLAYAGAMLTFVHANKLTTAASAIFLQAAAPLYIIALQPLLLRERVERSQLLTAPLYAVGLGLFFVGLDPVSETAPHPAAGNLVALLSGVFWAFTIIGLRALGRENWRDARALAAEPDGVAASAASPSGGSMPAVVAGNVFAVAIGLSFALLGGAAPFATADATDLVVISYLGVFQIGCAYLFITRGLRHATAVEAGLVLLLEPVLNPVWAALVHGERVGLWSVLGGVVIVVATVLRVLVDRRAQGPLQRV
jgi:drug/metabolite transporter (DMT)-like permease